MKSCKVKDNADAGDDTTRRSVRKLFLDAADYAGQDWGLYLSDLQSLPRASCSVVNRITPAFSHVSQLG